MSNILFNALGIQDSGGITVLNLALKEFQKTKKYRVHLFLYKNVNTIQLCEEYIQSSQYNISYVTYKNLLYRIFYENLYFPYYCRTQNIDIVYNFSGLAQLFMKNKQLVKIQNLRFYSKALDQMYYHKKEYFHWLKQIYSKRLILLFMLRSIKNYELQSSHVENNLSDYLRMDTTRVFIKSDILINEELISCPREYSRNKMLTILFIVGPHFETLHKNIDDFLIAMYELSKTDVDYRIKITIDKKDLEKHEHWNDTIDSKIEYLGYLPSCQIKDLFQDNSILISTSIIETIGLHVIESIINGVVPIVPALKYSYCVYGKDVPTYMVSDPNSLVSKILNIHSLSDTQVKQIICENQQYIVNNERSKHKSVVEIIDIMIKESQYV